MEKLEILVIYFGIAALIILIALIGLALIQLISYRVFGINLYKKLMRWIDKEIYND